MRIIESVQNNADHEVLSKAVSAQLRVGLTIHGMFASSVELLKDNIDTVIIFSAELICIQKLYFIKTINIYSTYLLYPIADPVNIPIAEKVILLREVGSLVNRLIELSNVGVRKEEQVLGDWNWLFVVDFFVIICSSQKLPKILLCAGQGVVNYLLLSSCSLSDLLKPDSRCLRELLILTIDIVPLKDFCFFLFFLRKKRVNVH